MSIALRVMQTRLSPVLPRGSCAAACRWALHRMPSQRGGRSTAPPLTAVSGPRHQLQCPITSSRTPLRFVPARCSGSSAFDAAGDGDGPGERGQPPPAPAGDAKGCGISTAAKELVDARRLQTNGVQKQQTLDLQTPQLQEALVVPFLNEQVDFRAGQLELRAGQVDFRAEQLDIRAGQVDFKAGQLEIRAGHIDFRAVQLEFRAGQLEFRAGQVESRAQRVDFRAEQLDFRAVLQRQQEGQQELVYPVQALEKQQEEQHKEQQTQQEHPQQHVSTLTAHGNAEDMETSSPSQSAVRVPSEQTLKRAPRLMDCVRLHVPDNSSCSSGSHHMVDGVVLGSADGGARLKVWTLPDPQRRDHPDASQTVICAAADCEPLASNMPCQYQYLPYDPECKGVPVTSFTAAPGMLVRRGYHVRDGEEDAAAAGEVGVLQPSPDMGDTLLVEWASGSRGTYHTGYDFELVHLETSLTSGVPVVGKYWTSAKTHNPGELLWGGKELERPKELVVPMNLSGLPVERGTHWTYSEAEPGVGAIKGAGTVRQKGPHNPDGFSLPVKWPNGQLLHHRASPASGYDLCYSARPGDPVTLFTAREGLRVKMVEGGEEGVLVEPIQVFPGNVVEWYVDFRKIHFIPLIYIVGCYDAKPGSWARYPRSSKLQYI